jgi:hypothetical protein
MASIQWGSYWQFYPESSLTVTVDLKTFRDSEVKLACETWQHMANEMFRPEESRKRFALWAQAAYAEMVSRRLVA